MYFWVFDIIFASTLLIISWTVMVFSVWLTFVVAFSASPSIFVWFVFFISKWTTWASTLYLFITYLCLVLLLKFLFLIKNHICFYSWLNCRFNALTSALVLNLLLKINIIRDILHLLVHCDSKAIYICFLLCLQLCWSFYILGLKHLILSLGWNCSIFRHFKSIVYSLIILCFVRKRNQRLVAQ